MAVSEVTDADVVSGLSPEHTVTGITVCNNGSIVNHVQLQYGVFDSESGNISDVVYGVEHGKKVQATASNGITCQEETVISADGGASLLLFFFETDIV